MRYLVLAVACAGCNLSGLDDSGPIEVRAIEPDHGSVLGGTRVTIAGRGFTKDTQIQIGGLPCTDVAMASPGILACTTQGSEFVEGAVDVVATRASATATLPSGYAYECPWTTTAGRRSCGAVPPGAAAQEVVDSWVTQFQSGHAFTANPDGAGASNLADTSDHVLGDQSAFVATDGRGTPRTLSLMAQPARDFRAGALKMWVKVEGIEHVASLELLVGDSGLSNTFRFRLMSSQGQPWITDGDWVAFSIPWSADSYTLAGAPDRAAITDIMFRITDDGTGNRVRLHVNGLAVVVAPSAPYPDGVVSFTFDDNLAAMVDPGAAILDRYSFPATAYVIVDTVGTAGRATLDDLQRLSASGWSIAVHAFTDLHHFARYPMLPLNVVEDDMVDARAWLIEHGFRGYDHCAYPGGDFTRAGNDVLPLARRYFTSCRTIYQQRELYPPSDPTKLRVFYVTNQTALADALVAVDRAAAAGEWLILVFHSLVANPTTSTEWRIDDFRALVDHTSQVGIPVKTVSAVLTARTHASRR